MDVAYQKSWLKNVTTGIEVKVHQLLLVSQKIVVGEVFNFGKMPETHLHVCQVNVGEDISPSNRLWSTKCAGIKVMVALPGARTMDNYKIKKGKISLEPFGMICSLGELHFWLQYKEFRWQSKLSKKM